MTVMHPDGATLRGSARRYSIYADLQTTDGQVKANVEIMDIDSGQALSMPSATIASAVYLQVLNSGLFAFSEVSGFSSLISTSSLRGMVFSPSGCCLQAVLIWTSSGLAATLALRARLISLRSNSGRCIM